LILAVRFVECLM